MAGHEADMDRLARTLARNAGVDWDRLADYPGYCKYYWREQAQTMRAMLAEDMARTPQLGTVRA